ncbi:uncharacterized protein LOC130052827 isoform X2 [Ostrea edulis]|uniref:uncharacterized protein LOC125677093 isoform X2 n=1 Tax=Ostrea edulis TaxID=37623 RepID=UPI0024AFB96C|nr:uncharacterized protein LOC125677093 isoform X2 [Ostrea edulis]XP_056014881.1 uncharacterized protein LOC130052827 isoform X2 [Ostrea edulis]
MIQSVFTRGINEILIVTSHSLTMWKELRKKHAITRADDGCCSREVWDPRVNQCVPCNVGYTGKDCKQQCRYPYYGMHCLNTCLCNEMDCDFQIGCLHLQGSSTTPNQVTDRTDDKSMHTITSGAEKHNKELTSPNDVNENHLLHLVLGFGTVLLTCTLAYIILWIYAKIKNIHSEDHERRSLYAEPDDIVTLHI